MATLAGPKGLAWSRGSLYVADTENHVVRAIDLTSGIIRTVLGTGRRGDGPEPDPLRALSRPHGLCVDTRGVLYVSDSEAHRIRTVHELFGARALASKPRGRERGRPPTRKAVHVTSACRLSTGCGLFAAGPAAGFETGLYTRIT